VTVGWPRADTESAGNTNKMSSLLRVRINQVARRPGMKMSSAPQVRDGYRERSCHAGVEHDSS
jgi:hypothetical protein